EMPKVSGLDDEPPVPPARKGASSADVLGRKSTAGQVGETGEDDAMGRAAKAKTARRVKPLAVAETPIIGNYQLPEYDFLNGAEPGVKSAETKDELLANARLMQSTLQQFGIEVSLGDITKGPTITRYELHPAP